MLDAHMPAFKQLCIYRLTHQPAHDVANTDLVLRCVRRHDEVYIIQQESVKTTDPNHSSAKLGTEALRLRKEQKGI